jgi:hypothetical protein
MPRTVKRNLPFWASQRTGFAWSTEPVRCVPSGSMPPGCYGHASHRWIPSPPSDAPPYASPAAIIHKEHRIRMFHLHEYRPFSNTQRLCRSQQAVHYDRLFCLMEGRELQKTIPYGVERCLIFGCSGRAGRRASTRSAQGSTTRAQVRQYRSRSRAIVSLSRPRLAKLQDVFSLIQATSSDSRDDVVLQ